MSRLKSKNNLLVKILDSYTKYVEFGYPKDKKIYVIRYNPADFEAIAALQVIPESQWQFQIIPDGTIIPGKVIFGPETVKIDLLE